MTDQHWVKWHEKYDDPTSSVSRRLAAVQRRLRDALDQAVAGPVRVVSMCAGQGRDVIGVLADHPRRTDVQARLVELDPELVADARLMKARADLEGVDVVEGDASSTTAYADVVPANILLVCGVFGNISDDDIHRTVQELPRLVAPDATVIWTRHRRAPDLTGTIRTWFAESGFEEVGFDTGEGMSFAVGTHRFTGDPLAFHPDRRLFTFLGDGGDAHH